VKGAVLISVVLNQLKKKITNIRYLELAASAVTKKHLIFQQAGPDRYNKKIQDDPAQLIDRCRESARSLTW
jgi:hypothetical protein